MKASRFYTSSNFCFFLFIFYWLILIFSWRSRYFFFLSSSTLKSHCLYSKPKALPANFSSVQYNLSSFSQTWSVGRSMGYLSYLGLFSSYSLCFLYFVLLLFLHFLCVLFRLLFLRFFSSYDLFLSLWLLLSISLFFQ